MSGNAPIGVFDSGLGGLTVLAALRRAMPDQDLLYFGDNANAPYGARSPEEVYALTRDAVEKLFGRGCRLVLIACNTAAAIGLRRLQQEWLPQVAPDNRVLGVFVPLIEALTGRGWTEQHTGEDAPRHIAFFATSATVESGAFTREARRLSPALTIHEQPCPGLVDALEHGRDASAIVQAAVAAALAHGRPDAAILGCTHYPLEEAAFRAAMPGVTLLSQPEIVADSLGHYLDRHPRFRSEGGTLTCITSGDPVHVSARARALLGHPLQFATCKLTV